MKASLRLLYILTLIFVPLQATYGACLYTKYYIAFSASLAAPANLQWAYTVFRNHKTTDTVYPKPLSARFTTTFTGTYPNTTPRTQSYDDFITLGFPVTQYKKTYEQTQSNGRYHTHTVHASGHIQCKAGDTHCNNALYALNNSRDFTKCMHMALSHPEIPRSQRCASLFAALGKYGLGEHMLSKPLCRKAWWTFDITLDND